MQVYQHGVFSMSLFPSSAAAIISLMDSRGDNTVGSIMDIYLVNAIYI